MKTTAAVLLVLIFGVTGCGGGGSSSSSTPTTQDITIHVINTWAGCIRGISTSTNLVLKDSTGAVVGSGRPVKTAKPYYANICDLTLSLPGVAASKFYTVETNDGTRLVTANEADLQGNVIRIVTGDLSDSRIGTCEEASKDGKLHYDSPDKTLC
jgi:hypothetical protein